MELIEAVCAQLLSRARGEPGTLRNETQATHNAVLSLFTGTDPAEARRGRVQDTFETCWYRTHTRLRNPAYLQACPPLEVLPAEVALLVYEFLRPGRRSAFCIRPLFPDRATPHLPAVVTVRVPGSRARRVTCNLAHTGAELLRSLRSGGTAGMNGAVLTTHRGRPLPLTIPLDFLDIHGGAALAVHLPPLGREALSGLLHSGNLRGPCTTTEAFVSVPTVTMIMRHARHLAQTSRPPPTQPRPGNARVALCAPGHKPILMAMSFATTLDDVERTLQRRGIFLPPGTTVWSSRQQVARGPAILAQRISHGAVLSVHCPLLGGAPGAGVAAEALLHPSNTDWRPLRDMRIGETRNLLLVPTAILVRDDSGWGVKARCVFGAVVPEVVLRAPFGVPPHLAGNLHGSCLACRSVWRESVSQIVIMAPSSVASLRNAPLLHDLCPRVFPTAPCLSSDIQRHLCVFADVGGSASGFEAAALSVLCTAVDCDPAVVQVFRARLPHATVICAALEDLTWWPQITGQGFDTLTASPPCPPFSRAGFQRGAADPRAAVWPVLLLLVQLLKPVRILLENVAGIADGPGRPFVSLLSHRLESYGYLVATQVQDAGDFLPATRKRWFLLAVLRSRAVATALASLQRQPPPMRLFSSALCLWPNLQSAAAWQAEWSAEESAVYSDPERRPKGAQPRILAPGDRLPTVLRLYGTAPLLARGAMSSDVVFGFGIRATLGGRETVRHITAPELAAAMGFLDWHTAAWSSVGGDDRRVLWPALGDTVSPPQALWYTLLLTRATRNTQVGVDPEEALRRYLSILRVSLEAFRPDRPDPVPGTPASLVIGARASVSGVRPPRPPTDPATAPATWTPRPSPDPTSPRSRSPRPVTSRPECDLPSCSRVATPRRGSAHTVDPVALALARPPDDPGAARERQERCFADKAARAGTHQMSLPAASFILGPRPDTSGDARMARDLHAALNGLPRPPSPGASRRRADPGRGSRGAPVALSHPSPTPLPARGVYPVSPTASALPPPRGSGWEEVTGKEPHGAPISLSDPADSPPQARGGKPISPTASFHSEAESPGSAHATSPPGRWISPGGSRLPCSPTLSWDPPSPEHAAEGTPEEPRTGAERDPTASILLRMPEGRFIPYHVSPHDTVRTMRPFLSQRSGIPPTHLTLALHSRTLREDTSLLSQGVTEASCIDVAVRFFGGGEEPARPSPRRRRLNKRAADARASPPHRGPRTNGTRPTDDSDGGPDASSLSSDLQDLSLAASHSGTEGPPDRQQCREPALPAGVQEPSLPTPSAAPTAFAPQHIAEEAAQDMDVDAGPASARGSPRRQASSSAAPRPPPPPVPPHHSPSTPVANFRVATPPPPPEPAHAPGDLGPPPRRRPSAAMVRLEALRCRLCPVAATAHLARDGRGLVQHMVTMHMGEPLSVEAIRQLRALDKAACRICSRIRAQATAYCAHCGCSTGSRPLALGDVVPDRRRPVSQATVTSDRPQEPAPGEPRSADPATQDSDEAPAGPPQVTRAVSISHETVDSLPNLGRASLLHIPRAVAHQVADTWAEALEGCLSGDATWALLARYRCRLLLAPVPETLDRNTELKRRLLLWRDGHFDALAQHVLLQQVEERRREGPAKAGQDPKALERRARAVRHKVAVGAIAKAVQSLLGGVADLSADERAAWTRELIPRSSDAVRAQPTQREADDARAHAWGQGDPAAAREALRQAGKRPGGPPKIPWAHLSPLTAPGPSGERQEHLDDVMEAAGPRQRRRLLRALDTLAVLWAVNQLPSTCAWLLNTQILFLRKDREPRDKTFDDEAWVASLARDWEDDGDGGAPVPEEPAQLPTSPKPRPIQQGEFLRKWTAKRLMAANHADIARVMAAMRQIGVGLPGGAEALAIFHKLLFGVWMAGRLPRAVARVKVDLTNIASAT